MALLESVEQYLDFWWTPEHYRGETGDKIDVASNVRVSLNLLYWLL